MASSIDLLGFFHGAMIEPEDNVAFGIEVRSGDRDGFAGIVSEDS